MPVLPAIARDSGRGYCAQAGRVGTRADLGSAVMTGALPWSWMRQADDRSEKNRIFNLQSVSLDLLILQCCCHTVPWQDWRSFSFSEAGQDPLESFLMLCFVQVYRFGKQVVVNLSSGTCLIF